MSAADTSPPPAEETPEADGARLYRRLLGYVRPYRGQLVIATIAMGIVAATSSSIPVLVQPVMDGIFVDRRGDMLLPIALGVIALFSVKGLANYIQAYLMGRVGHRIVADLRLDLQQRMLDQDLQFFHDRPAGEIVSRLTYDTTQVQNAVTRALTGIFQHSLTIVGLTIVIFWQNWRLALAAMIVFPLAVAPLQKFGRAIRRYASRGQAQMGTLSARLYEVVSGIRVVKVFGMEDSLGHKVRDEIEHLYHTFRRTSRVEAISSPLMEWFGALGVGAVILVGGRFVIDGTVTAGEFFAFTAGVLLLYDPVRRMNGTWQQIQQGIAAAERLFAWLDLSPKVASPPNGRQLETLRESLRFERVCFRYAGDGPAVLDGVDFELRRGEVVALVGPSGAGKSTIADLVPRFYDPTEGSIRIDGTDLREFDLGALRGQISMVDQHTVLFDDTVAANIRYGRPDADDASVESAARAAFADDFIRALPRGYDTRIGEDGVNLSGGQRQRIAIARALLKDAPILILDEATSALDSESEREVQRALERLLEGRTALVIAHRLSTIRHASRILVIERGRILESGPHDELLARPQGAYRRMLAMQAEIPG